MVPIKRAAEDGQTESTTAKKRRVVHHKLRFKQPGGILTALIPHDHDTVDKELEKCLGLALQQAGFDSYRPSAMESFKGLVNEYMTRLSHTVSASMRSSRRTLPVPNDFARALSARSLSSASLEADLRADIPFEIAQSALGVAQAADEPIDVVRAQSILSRDLGGASEKKQKRWVPQHFPDFPSQHTYKDTPVITQHEADSRKVREQATQEGMLAEQALRRLMVARQKGTKALRRSRKQQGAIRGQEEDDKIFQDALTSILGEGESSTRNADVLDTFQADVAVPSRHVDGMAPTDVDFGAIVNYDKGNWRKGAQDWISAL